MALTVSIEWGTRDDVRFWPKADIPSCTAHVRFWGEAESARGSADANLRDKHFLSRGINSRSESWRRRTPQKVLFGGWLGGVEAALGQCGHKTYSDFRKHTGSIREQNRVNPGKPRGMI